MYASHILIICAAPGDELVGATAAITRARDQGYRVSALMLSNGAKPAPKWKFWAKNDVSRRAEKLMIAGRQAAGILGFEFKAWNVKNNPDTLWRNIPRMAAYLKDMIAKLEPTAIWVPAFTGQSPDHDAVNLAVSAVHGDIETFEFVAIPITPDGKRYEMAFPQKRGLLMPLNIADAESVKRRRAIELLQRAGADLVLHEAYRETFRPMIKHDYTKPPLGYVPGAANNPSRSNQAIGARIMEKVQPYVVQFLQAGRADTESQ